MLKAAGLFLLFSGCFSLGIGKSRGLKKRLELLRELKKLLLLLSGEIRCAKTPLPEAFRKIGRKAEDPFGTFFQKVAEELTGEKQETAGDRFFQADEAFEGKSPDAGRPEFSSGSGKRPGLSGSFCSA